MAFDRDPKLADVLHLWHNFRQPQAGRKLFSTGGISTPPSSGSALVKKVEQRPPVDHTTLINALDDTWRSPSQIRARVASGAWSLDVAAALERLANSGLIDRRTQETPVHRRGGGSLAIKHYRLRTA